MSTASDKRSVMYELVYTAERNERSPLHRSVTDAIEYVEANAEDGEQFEVWQVADDIDRTRMVMIVSGQVEHGVAHYFKRQPIVCPSCGREQPAPASPCVRCN